MTIKELREILQHLPDDMAVGFLKDGRRTWHFSPIRHACAINIAGDVTLCLATELSRWMNNELTSANIANIFPQVNRAFNECKAQRESVRALMDVAEKIEITE